jgi:hypothetical protein
VIEVGHISGAPTAEEVAAIVAAIELTWPRIAHMPREDPTPVWRFSGRWWGDRAGWPPSSF